MQRERVLSLVGKLRAYKLLDVAKKNFFFKEEQWVCHGGVKNIHSLIYKNILYAVLFSGDSVYNC